MNKSPLSPCFIFLFSLLTCSFCTCLLLFYGTVKEEDFFKKKPSASINCVSLFPPPPAISLCLLLSFLSNVSKYYQIISPLPSLVQAAYEDVHLARKSTYIRSYVHEKKGERR